MTQFFNCLVQPLLVVIDKHEFLVYGECLSPIMPSTTCTNL